MEMIPKVIHYCWFGGKPLSELAEWCLASWRKHMPDYEIVRWDESNFDVKSIPFTAEAYRYGKWAFVSDYARLWAVYHHGGIYLDTDVELRQSLEPLCRRGAWVGREYPMPESPGLYPVALGLGFAMPQGHPLLETLMVEYQSRVFADPRDKEQVLTIVRLVSEVLTPRGLSLEDVRQTIDGVEVYPTEYLCPKDYATGKLHLTPHTYSIHHYDASWVSSAQRRKDHLVRSLGPAGRWLVWLKQRLAPKG